MRGVRDRTTIVWSVPRRDLVRLSRPRIVDLFERIARLYEEGLRVPASNVCRLRCDARDKRPLLPWHVGDHYESDPRRLVIVGKPHRDDLPTVERPAGTQDGRVLADRLFRTRPWPFWRYTREVLARVYGSGEEGWDRVVLTTIVKCTSARGGSEGIDETTSTMKVSCIREVGVLRRELEILKPRTLVLYTGRGYDDWLEYLCWSPAQRWQEVTGRLNMRDCGGIPMPWREGEIAGGEEPVRVLRLGHPQGKPMAAYVGMLHEWLTRGGVLP